MAVAPSGTSRPRTAIGAWWALTVLFLLYILAFIDRNLLSMFVEPIRRDLGIGDFMMGIILGPAFSLASILLAIPLGWMGDRFMRRGVIFGGVASGIMLYGMSWLFGLTQSLNLAEISRRVVTLSAEEHRVPEAVSVAVICMLAGFGYKISAAPFHMWIPDVYEGAPTAMVVFVGSAPKLAAFGMAYRLLEGGMAGMHEHWTMMLSVLAVLSLAIGNVFAIAQTNLKRLLGYSTISHIGFLLLGFVNGTSIGFAAAQLRLCTSTSPAGTSCCT